MKRTFLLLLPLALLVGCNALKPQAQITSNQNQPVVVAPIVAPNNLPVTQSDLLAAVESGQQVEEIKPVTLSLPEGIYQAQIQKYFKLGDIYLALVLRPSMNIFLPDLPKGYTTEQYTNARSGVLVARTGETSWTKLLTISDPKDIARNNFYYLWSQDQKIYLSVVDQNGAGSGEGLEKVLTLNDKAQWALDGCYYFGYIDVSVDGDYFAFSKKLDKMKSEPKDNCNNLTLSGQE